MNPARTTGALAAALVGALLLDAWLRWPVPLVEIGRLPAFKAEEVAAVRISKGDDEWTLARRGESWSIPGPPERTADAGRVGELLNGLSRGVPLDAQVDRGSYEDYGLGGADPVRVDLLGPNDVLLSSVVIGFDAGGGATWVRLPGDDAVFRARVGGRGRYDRPLAAWRDREVVAVADLRALHVERPDGSYVLRAGQPWTVDGDPGFEVDPLLTSQVARVLSHLTALDVATRDALAGSGAAMARIGLESASGTVVLQVWPGAVTLEGGDVVFRVTPALTGLLGGPLESWRDHTLWSLDPATVSELRLDEAEQVILSRAPGGWTVVEPAGVVADPQRAASVAAFLANPRVDEWVNVSPVEAGFLGGPRIVVANGSERRTMEIGAPVAGRRPGHEALYVRDPRRPERIGTWGAAAWAQIRAGFGR